MTESDTELVSILVPKRHLARIYGYISTLDDAAATPAARTDQQADTEADSTWTPDLVRRQFEESPDTIKAFQLLLAEHPDEWFSTADIAARLGAEKGSRTIAGALGAYGRRTSNRYRMNSWPFRHRWNHNEGQQYYSMEPENAAIIREL